MSATPKEHPNPMYDSDGWNDNSKLLCANCKKIMWVAPNCGGINQWKYKCGDCGQVFSTDYR